MKKWLILIFLFFIISRSFQVFGQDTVQKVIPGRTNSPEQQKKPYVILISADGFRWDLAEKYHAANLLNFRASGVAADYMQASFPSLTFPNHYTIVTGLYPAHHGLVDNTFFDKKKHSVYSIGNKKAVADSSWYGGDPLWDLAENQHLLSASFYWVASESAILGVRPTYYYNYNEAITMDHRIEAVKEWLQLPEEKRPHLITFYFPEVDHQEHRFGVDSKETEQAVHFVDDGMGKMVKTIDSLGLPVNFIFLADHGMMDVDTLHPISLPAAIDTTKFFVLPGGAMLHLYAKDSKAVQSTYQVLLKEASGYDVYLPNNTPKSWHYRKEDDVYNRIGDIILTAKPHRLFNINHRRMSAAEHGYDPTLTEMHATFYAWGPAFKNNKQIKGFENIHVYPLIAKILGLKIDDKIDGKLKVLKPVLKR